MKRIRPIVSFFLAGLILIASVGVVVNSHICMGEVKSVSLFVKADSCQPCRGADHHAKKNGCCEEESIIVKGKDTAAVVGIASKLSSPSFNLVAVILPVLYSTLVTGPSVATPQFTLYKPPLPTQDIIILVHSFLI